MFCPKCGKAVASNQRFCAGCGADLSSDQEVRTVAAAPVRPAAAPASVPAPVPAPVRPAKSQSGGMLFRIAGLLAAAAIAVSAFLPFWSYSSGGHSGSLSLIEYGLPGVIVLLIAAAAVLFSAAGIHAGNIGCGIIAVGYGFLRDLNLEGSIEHDYGDDASSMLELLNSDTGFYLLIAGGAVLLLGGLIGLAAGRSRRNP